MAQGDFTRINTNIGALNALNSLKNVQKEMGLHQLRLATGKRITEAADDPAGLTIATKFKYRASGLGVALDNIGDAKNMLAVAEGGLQKVNDILIKMRDKAEQAASDTLGSSERSAIQTQLNDFAAEIDAIVDTTKWNGNKLLDGLSAFSGTVVFQTGADTGTNDRISLTSGNFGSVSCTSLSIGASSSTVSETDAGSVTASIDAGNTTFSGLSELSTGTYTMRVHIGSSATDNTTADSTAQLVDSGGNVLSVDANGASGGLLDNKVTFAYDSDTATTVDFGNGLQVTLSNGLAANTDTANVTLAYTKSGTYNGSVSTASGARSAIDSLDSAIGTVSGRLQTVGALVSRLSFREETLTIAKVNTEAAYNRIMNADMAFEQLEATKMSILQQTATAMLSQANQAPQNVLSLFR